MEKILLVFTGGTIGSTINSKTINIDTKSSSLLLHNYDQDPRSQKVTFDIIRPLNILSENLISEDWMAIFDAISEADLQEYKGIIVTHGTDTLPFTAAALSYLFKDIDIPLVITASNYPLGQPKSNGLRNFINSVDFIIQYSTPGVFVIFENNQGESIVYLGTRLVQAAPFTNEFDSPYAIFYGKMINGVFFENKHPFNPSLEDLRRPRRPFDCPQVNFSDKILYIKPVPGLNYQHYNFSKDKPRAVLHDLYHSGTACTREEKEDGGFSLIKFIDYCYDNAVDIYIAPIVGISGDIYASSRALIQRGAVPLSNISIEAALAKLMLLYGCFDDSELIKHMVNDEPLFFECLIPVNKK